MKKGLTKLFAVVALVVCCGCGAAQIFWPTPVWAEEEATEGSSLRISPSGVRFTLKEGEVMEGSSDNCKTTSSEKCTVQVYNPSKKAVKFKVYITPYAVSGSDNELSFSDESGTAYTQISRWIEVKQGDEYVREAVFEVQPGETKEIDYRITVPDDIPGGSQYSVLWAQIINDDTSAGGIQTVGQVGSIISGRSETDSVEKMVVNDIQMTTFSTGGKLTATAKVKNEGNTDFVVNYRYVARSFFGKELYTGNETLAAYPGTEYPIEVNWDDAPALGIFQVELTVEGAGETSTTKRVVIIMPVIVMILVILLLTVAVAWIIIIVRKRKEQKARKLV